MTRPLWDKGGATVDERIMRFCAGEDVVLDRQLFVYDIRASKAHVRGLVRIGLLSEEEGDALVATLDELAEAYRGRRIRARRVLRGWPTRPSRPT